MSAIKSGLIGAGAVAGVVAILFASGTVSLTGPQSDDADAAAEDDDQGEGRKRRRKRKGRKRRGRGRGRGGDLSSLGYIGAVEMREEDRDKRGTVKHDKSRAHQGLSLYNPCAWGRRFRRAAKGKTLREARLIDNDGTVVHAWSTDYIPDHRRGWATTKLGEDGNLYIINARSGFAKIDWDSNTVWSLDTTAHHDFNFGPDGNIYLLIERGHDVEHKGKAFPVLDNGFAIVSPQGKILKEVWLYETLYETPEFIEHLETRLDIKPPKGGLAHDEDEDEVNTKVLFGRDIFHANTIDFATKTIEGVWNEGDIITSVRQMNAVIVLDKDTYKPKWTWGVDELDRQHDPEQLANGNLLIFDNGRAREWSRVLEVDPKREEIVWEYKHDDFFSDIRGLSQRLPNDNTLIVSSQRGRAFEVTTEGEIVWEYWNPDVLRGDLRVPFRLMRLEGKALAFAQKQLDEGKGNPDGATRPKSAPEKAKPRDELEGAAKAGEEEGAEAKAGEAGEAKADLEEAKAKAKADLEEAKAKAEADLEEARAKLEEAEAKAKEARAQE